MSTIQQKTPYQDYLDQEFTTIFQQCDDSTLCKPLYTDITNRHEIMFMQFDMQKKGKNFGIVENRLLKIQNNKLFQVDKNGEEKEIPIPLSITIIKREDSKEEFQDKYEAKIVMKFTQRNDITVYFRSVIESNQIGMFLMSQIRKRDGKQMDRYVNLLKYAVINSLVDKIQQTRQLSENVRSSKMKSKVNQILKYKLNDRTYIAQFMMDWKSKALFKEKEETLTITVQQFRAKTDKLEGVLKIWAKGTVTKQITLHSQMLKTQQLQNSYVYTLKQVLTENWQKLLSYQELQIELQNNLGLWKSERFTACDLRKIHRFTNTIDLNLNLKNDTIIIRLSIDFQGRKQTSQNISINPKHYRVIDELYADDNNRFQLTNIHHHYTHLLQRARAATPYYCCFNRLKILFQYLKVEELIAKFYSIYPFKDINQSQAIGSYIYQYFIKDYEKDNFYDVETLIWKFKQKQYKPLLTALKVFDQNLKFNFTEPFFHIVKRMHQIASRQTVNRWKSELFAKTVKGIQSIAFFLTLAIIKIFPCIFSYQQFANKRSLPLNSLLFTVTLRKQMPEIWLKLNKLQLNIQAYFGSQYVNILSKLLEGDTFTRILLLILQQKKNEHKTLFVYTIIGAFLAIMQIVDQYRCAYASAEHYIITFQQISKTMPDKFIFFNKTAKMKETAKLVSTSNEFNQINDDITDYYLTNAYSGDLGEISQQIYQQFTCYHFKSQADLRKIFLLIDKIQIGQQSQTQTTITLTIFQSAVKLYQHTFTGVSLNHLDHFIELKLIKLEELTLICNTQNSSFSCRIDPKEVPSNLYFHCVKPLILTYHLAPECNRHICFQTYIKDNCEIDSLQNPIPTKYRQKIMQNSINKQDLTFCKKFNKSFRMRQNNFNLLYSKLGWYGNHYLIPDERLINLQIISNRRSGQEQLYSKTATISQYTRMVYGKAIIPYPVNEARPLLVQIIKEKIKTVYEPSNISSQHDTNLYNSASRLLCYELDNFYIPSSIQFLQFYYQITNKLPLIRYLSYHPKMYYSLPIFTFQIANSTSTCTIIVTSKGIPFLTTFQKEDIQQIQEKAADFSKLPEQMEISYSDEEIYFDDFMYYLRLNILKRVIQLGRNRKPKGKKWPNSLVSSTISIPNYELYHFYQVMNETKQIVQLQFKQVKKLAPIIKYDQFGLIGGRWRNVYCIALLKSSSELYYYVIVAQQRKKCILKQSDFISTLSSQRRVVNLTDDIANSMEVITYELNQMFDF